MALPEVPNRIAKRRAIPFAEMEPVPLADAVPDIEIPDLEIAEPPTLESELTIPQLGNAIEYKQEQITKMVDEHDRRRLEIKSLRRDLAAQFSALSRRVNAVLTRADGVK